MPKHKPVKFEATLEPSLKKELTRIFKEKSKAKTALNATLGLIAFSGILTCAIVAPGAFSIFSHSSASKKRERYEEYQKIWRNFQNLKKRGDLEFVREKDGYMVYKPTKKGREKIKKLILSELVLGKPKKWDGKWRLIIFDIPERHRKNRDALRNKLQEMNFYQCQKSVWVHPFPCLEEIEFLKNTLNIKPFVKIFLVEEMTDGKVLYHFRNLLKESL